MGADPESYESSDPKATPGWTWIPDEAAYFWWDGDRYSERAEWDGDRWKMRPTDGEHRTQVGTRIAVGALSGLALALFLDMVIFVLIANSPPDARVMSIENGVRTLIVLPIVGLVLGAAIGIETIRNARRNRRRLSRGSSATSRRSG